MLLSCNSNDKKNAESAAESTIFSSKNHSELFLDSLSLDKFFEQQARYQSIKEGMIAFYKKRAYQYAWISEGQINESAMANYSQVKNNQLEAGSDSLGSSFLDSFLTDANIANKNLLVKENAQNLEMQLTASLFLFAERENSGKMRDLLALDWFIPRKKKILSVLIDSMLSGQMQLKSFEPTNLYYQGLKAQLMIHLKWQVTGNWPVFPFPLKSVKIGESDSSIANIKKLLFCAGDGVLKDQSFLFTPEMRFALQHFQQRMGLTENGKLDKATLIELQVPVQERIKQILLNLERLKWLPDSIAGTFLIINIPEFKLHLFENGKPVWESNVVVGSEAGKTSVFAGKISQIILNPTWGVPPGMIKSEILAGLKRHSDYLETHNMLVYEQNTLIDGNRINWHKFKDKIPYTIRQQPGGDNPLGQFKLLFPNSYHIYLHDTPARELFQASKRDKSHGCIRVEKIRELVDTLLKSNLEWTAEKINETLETNVEKGISVKPKVPVYMVYLTSWMSKDGLLNFRPDVYGKDSVLAKAMFGE